MSGSLQLLLFFQFLSSVTLPLGSRQWAAWTQRDLCNDQEASFIPMLLYTVNSSFRILWLLKNRFACLSVKASSLFSVYWCEWVNGVATCLFLTDLEGMSEFLCSLCFGNNQLSEPIICLGAYLLQIQTYWIWIDDKGSYLTCSTLLKKDS